MDTANTQIQQQSRVPVDVTQQDLEDMAAFDQRLDVAMEVAKLQEIAQQIEAEGTSEMKAKLKPFKDHYDGDVMTLITKRTKQNFDNDVWQDVLQAGDEAKAKYRQNPEAYLTEDKRAEYWQKAFDKTVDEARKLAQNLEQVLASGQSAANKTEQASDQQSNQPQRRRLFNRG